MGSLGILGAFIGGILTLISPCSALLLPAFFAYSFGRVSQLLTRTALLYVGLCITLVPLGAGLGAVGSFFDSIRSTVMMVAGISIIIFGVLTILGRGYAFRPAQQAMSKLSGTSALSMLALGCVYGLAGFCSGPILGSILTIAVAGGSAAYGGLLMACYALGMATPLFVLAALWERFQLGQRGWLRGKEITVAGRHLHTTSLISGLLFISIGIIFVATDGTAGLGSLVSLDTQYAAQVWASRIGGAHTNLIVLLVVLLCALVVVAISLMRRRSSTPSSPSSDSSSTTNQ